MFFLETPRLYLREIQVSDYESLCSFLQDIDVMYAWEHAFSDEEVSVWIDKSIMRYKRDGYSFWAVMEKTTEQLIGVTGLLSEIADEETYVGIGYIYNKSYWGSGYAIEAATACTDYAFTVLHLPALTAQIRPENTASIKVAEKLGMTAKKSFIKNHKDKEITHFLYSVSNV